MHGFPFVLFRAERLLDARLRARLADRDVAHLSTAQALVLVAVRQGLVPVAELARDLAISRQGLHGLSQGLQRLGLVAAERHPDDRRIRLLGITDFGRPVADSAVQALDATERDLRERLGAVPIERVTEVLSAID